MKKLKVRSSFDSAGDQPKAIAQLVEGLKRKEQNQVLLGVTGSGKTFTMAKVIEALNRPALIMAHNKTLAAQLYEEMKYFFPDNAVEYFVSYYDYYQPEAYIPRTDTFIEKDSSINDQIDLLRHSATRSLLERKDVIVVASISCIYGLGSPELYSQMTIRLDKDQKISLSKLLKDLVALQYERNDIAFERGDFRVRGDIVDIFPSHYSEKAWKVEFFGDQIEQITEFDPLTGKKLGSLDNAVIYANSHFVTPQPTIDKAIKQIKTDLKIRLTELYDNNKLIEAQRIDQRTQYDVELLHETGVCKGIENYSRYLTGREPGSAPPTLFEYLPKDAILFVDESHVTVPQIYGMYNGDRSRKTTLVDYGFRLPSALDNRPLKFEEWELMRPQTIFVSATPGKFELGLTEGEFVEQLIRPTGLVDPICTIKPVEKQVDDLFEEIKITTAKNYRTLVTTLTKKMAEDLTEYLKEFGIKVAYLHSEVLTLERVQIIQDLRKGIYDVIVGVNLLREGLDIPECGLVAILDADKEGFLRSETSLIQTIGRAARNVDGRVILYADKMTNSINRALAETDRRRKIQIAHNIEHNITPRTAGRTVKDEFYHFTEDESKLAALNEKDLEKEIAKLKKEMIQAAGNLDFEKAATIRDQLKKMTELWGKD